VESVVAKDDDRKTTVLGSDGQPRSPADLDKMMTTVRSVEAGRLVVVDGPGKGQRVAFFRGTNSIGRDAARNVVSLDFGDTAIHREHHAYLTFDGKVLTLSDNGKQNPVKVNGALPSGDQVVGPSDEIVLGKTTLRIERG
jgi:hypothetical protein